MTGFLSTLRDTSPSSAAQQFVSTYGVPNQRARVLGGGSAINVGFFSRASREYVEEVGWEPRLVNKSYKWVERKVAFRPQVMGWQAAFRDGLVEAGVSPDNGFTYEHLQGTKIGGSIFDRSGNRHTAADLLEYADQTMITGMSDNPNNVVLIPSPRPVENSLVKVVGIADDVGCYIEGLGGFFGSGLLSTDQSLIQSTLIVEKLARPFSIGYLELRSNDPNENPEVTFNYFKDPRDLQMCVKSMKIVGRVVESKAYSRYRYPNTTFESVMQYTLELSRKQLTDSLEQFCIDTVRTIWHYHGGCQVGQVVDSDYRVMGVYSLRVIDGSTFINSPGTNPQATLMMLGRYMHDNIRLL
ncbi:hypothetical protein ACS0TY_000237 [Phlomoides rotata]